MWIFNILKVYMWLTLSSIRESNIWFLKVELLIVSGNLQTVVLWPPHAKSWLIGKDSDAGRDWWQEEKGTTEDEMDGWHHWLNGHEFEWTPEIGDEQGGLACCDSWGRKELDTTEQLNWNDWTDWNLFLGSLGQVHYVQNRRINANLKDCQKEER